MIVCRQNKKLLYVQMINLPFKTLYPITDLHYFNSTVYEKRLLSLHLMDLALKDNQPMLRS